MRWLAVTVVMLVAAMPGLAGAVGEDGVWGNDQLLAWSRSGACFSVLRHSNADHGVLVTCATTGKDVTPEGELVHVNDRAGRRRLAAQYDLVPIAAAQRNRFAATYSVSLQRTCDQARAALLGLREGDVDCRWTWQLVRISDGAVVGPRHRDIASYPAAASRDRAAFLGGYLHASHRFALVKFNFVHNNGDHSAFFELVELAPETTNARAR